MDLMPEDALLEQCPRCRYSLRGLPVEHYCPECGLTIDRRWRVFGGRSLWQTPSRPVVVFAVVAVCLVCIGSILVLTMMAPRFSFNPMGATWQGLFMLLLPAVVVWSMFSKPKRFIAVGPRGLAIYRGRGQIEEHAWDCVGKARYDMLRKTLVLTIDNKPVRLSGNAFFRGDVFGAESCVRYVNNFPRSPGRENLKTEPAAPPGASRQDGAGLPP